MRKRIWKIHTDAYHRTMGEYQGRYTLMSGNETHVRYMWNGKAANIHASIYICRVMAWESVKVWVKRRWNDQTIPIWLFRIGVGAAWSLIVVAMLVIARHEGML